MTFQYQDTTSGETRIPGTDLRTRIRCTVSGTYGEVVRQVTETWGRAGDPFNAPRQVTADKVVATTERFPAYHTDACAKVVRELACRKAGVKHVPFVSWNDVLSHIAQGNQLYYAAPLDREPMIVVVLKSYKNGKLRLRAKFGDVTFTADRDHLDRFRYLCP
jgi:hypothetical protein